MLSAVTTTTSSTTGRNHGSRRLTRPYRPLTCGSCAIGVQLDRRASDQPADSRVNPRPSSTIRERVPTWITSQIESVVIASTIWAFPAGWSAITRRRPRGGGVRQRRAGPGRLITGADRMELADKLALVTGGGRGIGHERQLACQLHPVCSS